MTIFGALRNTIIHGTLWILYQIDQNQLNFKEYFVDENLDGLLFGTTLNLDEINNL
jgi:hypothetical protein